MSRIWPTMSLNSMVRKNRLLFLLLNSSFYGSYSKYSFVVLGFAARDGLQTGDKLTHILDNDNEISVLETSGLTIEALSNAIIKRKEEKINGNDSIKNKISVMVQRSADESDEVNEEEEEEDYCLQAYVRRYGYKLFSSGHCWAFDDFLMQSDNI